MVREIHCVGYVNTALGEGDTLCGIREYSFMVREIHCVGYVNTALWLGRYIVWDM